VRQGSMVGEKTNKGNWGQETPAQEVHVLMRTPIFSRNSAEGCSQSLCSVRATSEPNHLLHSVHWYRLANSSLPSFTIIIGLVPPFFEPTEAVDNESDDFLVSSLETSILDEE